MSIELLSVSSKSPERIEAIYKVDGEKIPVLCKGERDETGTWHEITFDLADKEKHAKLLAEAKELMSGVIRSCNQHTEWDITKWNDEEKKIFCEKFNGLVREDIPSFDDSGSPEPWCEEALNRCGGVAVGATMTCCARKIYRTMRSDIIGEWVDNQVVKICEASFSVDSREYFGSYIGRDNAIAFYKGLKEELVRAIEK